MQERHLSDLADTLFKSLGESLGAQAPPSALLIHPLHCTPGTGEILQRDPGRQLRKQHSSPPPTRSSPRISRGFGRTRLFLEPSGGAFDKRAPSMAEPPGNGASGFRPALIGGLHRVTAAGHLPDRLTSSRPLSIPRIPTGPCAPLQPLLSPTALLKRRHRQCFLISGTDCHASARNSDPASESSRG